ncbi:MAG: two-component regulator propeller domain-containing protein [Flammeovirgaceae bacterium]
MKQFLIITLCFILPITVTIGQQYNFKRYSIEEGLSRSGVYDVYEDSRGFLWIATEGGGVDRFDGKTMVNYNTENGLPSNVIRSICEDKEGNMWFGSEEKGAIRFDGHTFVSFGVSNTDGGIKHNTIRDIVQDDDGNMWFGTFGGGVSKFNPTSYQFEVIDTEKGLPHDKVRSLLKDNKGHVWIGTDGGLAKYNGVKLEVLTTEEGLPHERILCIYEDGSKAIWIGTPQGVAKYNGSSKGFTVYQNELIQKRVKAITQDNNGHMWFGTRDGASRFDGSHVVNFTQRQGLSSNRIRSILFDSAGNLWFGTYFGGVCKYTNDAFAHFMEKDGLPSHQVYAIHAGKDDKSMYLGTFEGLTQLNLSEDGMINSVKNFASNSIIPQEKINCLLLDDDNILWIGTDNGLLLFDGKILKSIDASEGLAGIKVNAIFQESPTSFWVATMKGASHLTKKTGSTMAFEINHDLIGNTVYAVFKDSDGFLWFGHDQGEVTIVKDDLANTYSIPNASHNIIHILEDKYDRVWVATEGDGLFKVPSFRLMPDSLQTESTTTKEGLKSNFLHLMAIDELGNIWVGSEKGIDKLSFKNEGELARIKHYGKEEGFTGIETNQNAVTIDKHGQIWFGTIKGVTRYNYLTRHKNNLETRTHIIEVKVNQEEVDWTDKKYEGGALNWFQLPEKPVLPYNQNNLTFTFTGINLKMPTKVLYQWKLVGLDEDWSKPSTQTEVNYSNLPDREYIFQVRSCNEDRVWNKVPAAFSFEIEQPFWRSPWFYAIFILATYLLFFIFFKWRTKRLLVAKQKLERLVEDRTIEIREKNVTLEQQKEEINTTLEQVQLQKATIEEEREKIESLLLNILPKATAEELRIKGYAEPQAYEKVTIMFTDFKGFTQVAEKLTPTQLVKELEQCFLGFDEILDRYNLEKIKTIGDSYMCAGGIPIANDTNPVDAVRAGLEIQAFMERWKKSQQENNLPFWDVRVGIHTGEVVAGVVGKKKFAYDIWGDAVNLASRMESSGEPQKVNISGATFELIKDQFDCEYRGKVKAKNKGEVDMYFVNREIG